MNECEAKKCPKRKDMLRTSIRMRKGEEPSILNLLDQGPRRNFEIWGEGWWVGVEGGGGLPLVTRYWGGGAQYTFSYQLYNFKNIVGHVPPPPATLLRGPCGQNYDSNSMSLG